MTPLVQKDWKPFVVPTCVCGHVMGDHGTGRVGAGSAASHGRCFIRDCDCSRFNEVQLASADADPRGRGDGLGR